jgi:small conductance mechanosensitive channel
MGIKAVPDLSTIEQTKNTLIDLGLRYAPRVLVAFVTILVGAIIARRVGQLLDRWLTRRELNQPLRLLLTRLVGIVVVLLFLMIALQNLGVELLPLFASLGVAGVGVGLAAQGLLSNLFAGLTIIFSKPFQLGQYISVAGVEGQVEQISLMTTILLHADRSRVVIPNRKIVGEILHNHGHIRQLEISVGVGYGVDLDKALALCREVLSSCPQVLREPAPLHGISYLADSAITLTLRPWVKVDDYAQAPGHIYRLLVERLRAAAIEIPFPQREVRLLNGPATP